MTTLLRLLVVATLLLGVSLPGATRAAPTRLTLLHVNDTHSWLVPGGPKDDALDGTVGGIARAASVIGAVRAAEPNVLVLHAGDLFSGDLFFNHYLGVPELQLMMMLGFDALTLGNHEFDLGPGVLAAVLQRAGVEGALPVLAANLDATQVPALDALVQPAVMKEVGGVKVGIFGLTVAGGLLTNHRPAVLLEDLSTIAGAQAQALRAAGAQVVICLSHAGIGDDETIAAQVPGIDVIVGGHNHLQLTRRVRGPDGTDTLVVQAGSHYQQMGRVDLLVDGTSVTFAGERIIPLDASEAEAPLVKAVVRGLQDGIVARYGDVYHTPIGEAGRDVGKSVDPTKQKRDTPLGNLVTDALRHATGADLALTTLGLVSGSLPAGPLVAADVFRTVHYGFDPVSGYGFKAVTFELTGAEIETGLRTLLRKLGDGDDFALQVSGMRYAYESQGDGTGELVAGSVHIGGRRLDPAARYTLASNEGLALALPRLGVVPVRKQVLAVSEFEVVRNYVTWLGEVPALVQNRIRDVAARGH